MTQPNSPKPISSEPHPLVRIATLERKVAQLEQRLDKLESQKEILVESSPTKTTLSEKPKTEKESKLFEILSRSRKRETRMTKNGISQVEQSFNGMSNHAYQAA
ncbi:MAG: hypothetical protein ACYC6R_17110 [Anaerolineales bacterium]